MISGERFSQLTELFRIMYRASLKCHVPGLTEFLDDLEDHLDDYLKYH